MNNASHQFTTDAKPWNFHSGVDDCDECEGIGHYSNGVTCQDCLGEGHFACEVCGFNIQVAGFDCWVCEAAYNLTPAQMNDINPADIADAFAQAITAALNAQVTP